MKKELFYKEFDFSKDWVKEFEEYDDLPCPQLKTWDELCEAIEKKQARPKKLVIRKEQAKKAVVVRENALAIAKKFYAKATVSIDRDGVFEFRIHVGFPLELVCIGEDLKCFWFAIKYSDFFHIEAIGPNKFDLVYLIELYDEILL